MDKALENVYKSQPEVTQPGSTPVPRFCGAPWGLVRGLCRGISLDQLIHDWKQVLPRVLYAGADDRLVDLTRKVGSQGDLQL